MFAYVIVFVTPTLAFANSEITKCAWTSQNQASVEKAVLDSTFKKDEFSECASLLNYADKYLNQLSTKDLKYANILLTAAVEKTTSAQTIWILDQYRSQVISANTSATYAQLLEIFQTGMNLYFEKLDLYNQRYVEALESTNPSAVIEWTLLGELYKSEMVLAMDEWISKYYKNETSQLAASK